MKITESGRSTEQFLLAAKRAEIHGLQALAKTCQVVSCVCALIHQIQRERGLSNIYLASEGERCHSQRLNQAAAVQEAEKLFRELLETHYLKGKAFQESPRLLNGVAFVLQGLDELAELRQQVEKMLIDASVVTEAFGRLIAGLLSIVFEAADSAGDPAVSRSLVAQLNFMQGKEYAGQERAWAASGFARGFFNDDLKERLHNLKMAQAKSFAVFERFAEADQIESWEKIKHSEISSEMERLRGIIYGFNKSEQISSEISEIWYEKATCLIDAMHVLETTMTEKLLVLSGLQIDSARHSLREHKNKLEVLSVSTSAQPPMSMLLGENGATVAWSVSDGDASRSMPAPKSVYDLLREQADHLKRISEDLDEARRVLTERKLVEQAKGLLMKNLGLSEEMAYRKMQQKAMQSNLRLVEVSELLIAAAKNTGDINKDN